MRSRSATDGIELGDGIEDGGEGEVAEAVVGRQAVSLEVEVGGSDERCGARVRRREFARKLQTLQRLLEPSPSP